MKRSLTKLLTVLLCACFLVGCGAYPIQWNIGQKVMIRCQQDSLTENEVRLIALQYKNEYEMYYKDLLQDFWNMKVSEELTFAEYIKEFYVFPECKALLFLQNEARNAGISLNASEEEKIQKFAAEFYQSMTEDEKKFTNASESDVVNAISKYYLANKTLDTLLEGKIPEVSDEESRVCDVQMICVKSKKEAEKIYKRIQDGENFATLASENTINDEVEYSFPKKALVPEFENVIFKMKENEVSPIIPFNHKYYIIRMVEDYDSLLSKKNKENLLAKRKFGVWEEAYNTFAELGGLQRDNQAFAEVDLSKPGKFVYKSLFKIFQN